MVNDLQIRRRRTRKLSMDKNDTTEPKRFIIVIPNVAIETLAIWKRAELTKISKGGGKEKRFG